MPPTVLIIFVIVVASKVIGYVLTTVQFANNVIKRVYIMGSPDGDANYVKRAE